jgi:hypothetical protein
MTVDRVVMHGPRLRIRVEMRHELMAEEIEIDPVVRAAPLGATKQAAVEGARAREIVNRNRQVKRRKGRRHEANSMQDG